MGEDIISRYLWLNPSRYLGMCITYVRSRDEDAVIRRFGGDPTTARPMSLRDVNEIRLWQENPARTRRVRRDHAAGSPMLSRNIDKSWMAEYLPLELCPIVLTAVIGEWVVILEEFGYQGTRDEVARHVSKGTEMVSVYWDAKVLQYFLYAVDGEIVARFELGSKIYTGSDPGRLNAKMADLPFESGKRVASALALAERITGVEFKPDWFSAERRGVAITKLPKDGETFGVSFALSRPEMTNAIRGASAIVQRRIALTAAERAAKESGLDGDQTIREALEAMRNPAADLNIARANLVPLIQRLEIEDYRAIERRRVELGPRRPKMEKIEEKEGPTAVINGVELRPIARIGVDEETKKSTAYQEEQKVRRQTAAGYAVYNALSPDAPTAAIQALSAASLTVSDSDGLFRDVLSLTTQ
ncbi:MAG: hypothetical protein J2P41_13150 [Blastocatellia bacterium]|nr:hypothetical protein [Blastocatellia bacterium]